MGSLKCDLSHITVHTVNNHTHTLQGDSNASRQPSGNRYMHPLACTCAHIDMHTSTHQPEQLNTLKRIHRENMLNSGKKVEYNHVTDLAPPALYGFNLIHNKPQHNISGVNGTTQPLPTLPCANTPCTLVYEVSDATHFSFWNIVKAKLQELRICQENGCCSWSLYATLCMSRRRCCCVWCQLCRDFQGLDSISHQWQPLRHRFSPMCCVFHSLNCL